MKRFTPLAIHRGGTGHPRRVARLMLVLLALAILAPPVASAADPVVGSWATYRWTSSVTQEVPVVVKEQSSAGQVTWSVARESAPPPPLFMTYSVVRGDAKTYVLQIVTHQTLDGAPLSVTQVTVDRASGKALKSVIQVPKGTIATQESGLRPFRQADVKGTEEAVAVPGGRFSAVRAPHRDGTVWVSDQIPALGLAKATFRNGQLELVRSGTSGAKDLLRS